MKRGGEKQDGTSESEPKQPKINQIASQLAKNKGIDSITSGLRSAKRNESDSKHNGLTTEGLSDGPLQIAIQPMESTKDTTSTTTVEFRPISAASTINQIATQLASNKNLQPASFIAPGQSLLSKSLRSRSIMSKMNEAVAIKPKPAEIKPNGTEEESTDGTLNIKIEKVESMQAATAAALNLQPVSASSAINKIANQLASGKSPNSQASSNFATPSPPPGTSKSTTTTTVVGKMNEALSLKQSPTLTKQLTTPVSGSANKMQVITQYMCRYCGQQFDSPTLMQQHIQDHVQGKAPHTCSVCGKEYRTPSKLQRHVRVHSGERPYACTVCGRRFTRSDHVKQHMKVHIQSEAKGDGKERVKLVPIKPKDQNSCHLCGDMRFSRRQALHLHLQQQHLVQQVFTCHRCGEAYESLEEMQSHKLTHDSILNSLKNGKDGLGSAKGVAKFALGPQKTDEIGKFDVIKPEKNPMEALKLEGALTLNANGYYVPANLENVSALSYKLLLEGMEKMAKENEEWEVQRKYQEELKKLNQDASAYAERMKVLEEQAKIAQCFTLKTTEDEADKGDNEEDGYKPMEEEEGDDEGNNDGVNQKTMVSADGMSMFILPTVLDDSMDSNDQEESDIEKDEDDGEQNSSKESVALNREGVMDKSEGDMEDKMDGVEEGSKSNESKETNIADKEDKISEKSNGSPDDKYTKPCPKSKKPGYIPSKSTPEIRIVTSSEGVVSKPMVSCINPKINQLIKAKVEQNLAHSPGGQTVTHGSMMSQILSLPPAPKLAFIPNNTVGVGASGTLQSLLLPVISGVTTLANSSVSPSQTDMARTKPDMSRMYRCEHCCMYFEDNAMCLLHNTLHAADEADPFTCRKCLKKLGNRLEFMAHLVWHLEPNMDI